MKAAVSSLQETRKDPGHCQGWWACGNDSFCLDLRSYESHPIILPFTEHTQQRELKRGCYRGAIPGDLDASLADAPAAHDLADMAASLDDALPLAFLLCCVVSAQRQRSTLRQGLYCSMATTSNSIYSIKSTGMCC